MKVCPFNHPKVCRKFLKNGNMNGGCNLGKDCSFTHPKMCKDSLKNRVCKSSGPGTKCRAGYHLNGTKSPQSGSQEFSHSSVSTKGKNGTATSPTNNGSFLSKILREEMREMLRQELKQMFPQQPVNQERRNQTYLLALLEGESA